MERSNIPYKTCNIIYKTLGHPQEKSFPIAKAVSNEDAENQFRVLTGTVDNINLRIIRIELAA